MSAELSRAIPSSLMGKTVRGIDAAMTRARLSWADHDISNLNACHKALKKIETRAWLDRWLSRWIAQRQAASIRLWCRWRPARLLRRSKEMFPRPHGSRFKRGVRNKSAVVKGEKLTTERLRRRALVNQTAVSGDETCHLCIVAAPRRLTHRP